MTEGEISALLLSETRAWAGRNKLDLGNDAVEEIRQMLTLAAPNIVAVKDYTSSSDPEKALINTAKIILEEIILRAAGPRRSPHVTTSVTWKSIKSVRDKLCPIFPFC